MTFIIILHITTRFHIDSLRNVGPSAYYCKYEAVNQANQIGIRASSITTITSQGTQKHTKDISLCSTMSMVKLNDKGEDIK